MNDPHKLWTRVRHARTYDAIVESFAEWLDITWPLTVKLGLAPRGKGWVVGMYEAPRILYETALATDTMARYVITTHRIEVGSSGRFTEEAKTRQVGKGDLVRETLLHEAVHAIRASRGIWTAEDTHDDHGHWFIKRLNQWIVAFPPVAI